MRRAGVAVPHGGDGWRSLVRLSTLGGELFLHSAFPTAEPDAVFFGPDTYRFAAAVEAHLERRPSSAPVRRAVDIGCGAGPGAILVAKARPAAAVLMVDINESALRLARLNAALAGAGNAQARRSDLLSGVSDSGPFDLVIANPPYLVDPSERAYRHGGGPLGAGLSLAILDAALGRLAPGGTLLLYTGAAVVNGHDPFRAAAEERLRSDPRVGWTYRETDPDVFGEELDTPAYAEADRIAAVVLTATRKG
jgi:methylase of polypeptide subunit release factors